MFKRSSLLSVGVEALPENTGSGSGGGGTAHEGNAAERLNYTPSGVSQLVGALEAELGFALLYRDKRGVRLTPCGEQLLPAVRDFLQQEQRLHQLAAEINGLSVGSVTIASVDKAPPAVRRFLEYAMTMLTRAEQ